MGKGGVTCAQPARRSRIAPSPEGCAPRGGWDNNGVIMGWDGGLREGVGAAGAASGVREERMLARLPSPVPELGSQTPARRCPPPALNVRCEGVSISGVRGLNLRCEGSEFQVCAI